MSGDVAFEFRAPAERSATLRAHEFLLLLTLMRLRVYILAGLGTGEFPALVARPAPAGLVQGGVPAQRAARAEAAAAGRALVLAALAVRVFEMVEVARGGRVGLGAEGALADGRRLLGLRLIRLFDLRSRLGPLM